MATDTKSTIYRTVTRPAMTYTAETRPETAKSKRLVETAEMKIICRITGETLLDRERSEDVRTACNVNNINEWVANRKKEWNEHISRMNHHRFVRIARDKSPLDEETLGAPGNDGATASSKLTIIEQAILTNNEQAKIKNE
ncbi:uncharacterized protein LOC125504409 [Dendroctonus ponderosae]|uniref:uncharacterized protein LOC125504409 n=1 Tax=Dendroctonus ponderosae TaxID=77166 RepID=UPI002034FCB0|nr:uncharacterized protein LOC125504409 [Dendroctonus ponderosae]